ncbi:peroxiredoxin-like family protein [Niveibacterium sp. SC-1]|uniref:peroxiredoxin family protein n=1 Tax=Niveibacterium sp. SC-1 TaxID=3135646 RepID=UPI00311E6721
MRLTPNKPAPLLRAPDISGGIVDLAEMRGRPVLLSFYRYASCPVCNLRVHRLIDAYPRLSAAGLSVLGVFQSSAEEMTRYMDRHQAPFPLVPDPQLQLYRRFGVETRWGALLSLAVIRSAVTAFTKGFLPGRISGPVHRAPADFLIAPDGRIALSYYGRTIDDHVPIAAVESWLQGARAT